MTAPLQRGLQQGRVLISATAEQAVPSPPSAEVKEVPAVLQGPQHEAAAHVKQSEESAGALLEETEQPQTIGGLQ